MRHESGPCGLLLQLGAMRLVAGQDTGVSQSQWVYRSSQLRIKILFRYSYSEAARDSESESELKREYNLGSVEVCMLFIT